MFHMLNQEAMHYWHSPPAVLHTEKKYVFLLFPSIHIYTPCTAKKNSNTKTQHRVVSLSVGFTHGTIMSSKLLLLEGVYGAVINGIVIGDTTKVCCGGEIANKHQLLDLSQD